MQNVVEKEIRDFVRDRISQEAILTRWGEPLVAFADANDPLFEKLREAVRPSHSMPGDLLPDARTVIVYFLPFEKDIARTNRKAYHASEEWAVAYVETNQLIRDMNQHLAGVLEKRGFDSADLPPTHNFDTEQLMSDWSHKHAAYIAGLGKFGTHHMLITDRGCCGRFGSLITDLKIEATERPDDREYCLYKHNGTCRVCIGKCVTGALTQNSFDRHKCYALLLENEEIYKNKGLADVCGKCVSIVPCSLGNPVKGALTEENRSQPSRDL
ncbi:MAG: (Fe-S)-binding protein [Desulfobacteraceae bacterium 4572_88]|nr:MAG: (Fe-S)-binding protein [Desulfobacteraceae bacterium 4572_88]